tara:strand:+ start:65 stop:253 length:189 start_codon:yes stop_codon:yes gene_type:complete
MYVWYRIALKDPKIPFPNFWLAAKSRAELDALLKKKGYTEIESIKEDPDFPACLDKPADRLK